MFRSSKSQRRTPLISSLIDAWDARCSGKAGVPTVADTPLTPTGRQSEIWRVAAIHIAKLRHEAQADTRQSETDLARLQERLRQLDEQLAVAGADEAAVLAKTPERLPVEAGVPDAVITARRTRDNVKEAAPARARIDQLLVERGEVALQAALIDHDIVMRWRGARAAANGVREIAQRREARYFRLLCRRHPEGARLADAFDHSRPDLPHWIDLPHDERSL